MKKKMSKEDFIFNLIGYIAFTLITMICFYPFYYLLICTISDNQMVAVGKITIYPVGIHFTNYVNILKLENLLSAAQISVMRTVLGTGVGLAVSSYLAYFFTKQEMWGRKFWYRLVIITMYFSAGLIPGYLNMRMLGLVNTFWVYILPGVSVYNMILIKTYIESLPASLEESAVIDGAGYIRRFLQIVLPLSKPILATVGLFMAVGHWNDFFTTKLYITKPRLYTLQFLLYEYLNQITSAQNMLEPVDMAALDAATSSTTASVRMTMTAVVVIPIICVYPFIQKYYVKGIMIGAVKG